MVRWNRLLKFLATGTVSLLLTSCYGTVQPMYGVPLGVRETAVKVTNSAGAPISGLVVTALSPGGFTDAGVTGTDGEAIVLVEGPGPASIGIHDPDGGDNGGSFDPASFESDGPASTVVLRRR